jgi:hypothetical protein
MLGVTTADPYDRRDLAEVHHLGFGFHADRTAPGVLATGHGLAVQERDAFGDEELPEGLVALVGRRPADQA